MLAVRAIRRRRRGRRVPHGRTQDHSGLGAGWSNTSTSLWTREASCLALSYFRTRLQRTAFSADNEPGSPAIARLESVWLRSGARAGSEPDEKPKVRSFTSAVTPKIPQ